MRGGTSQIAGPRNAQGFREDSKKGGSGHVIIFGAEAVESLIN